MPGHERAQSIAQQIYLAARSHALRAIEKAIKEIDKLHQADADSIKRELARMKLTELQSRRVSKTIDDVLTESRGRRAAAVEKGIIDAAKAAGSADKDTFHEIFGPEVPNAPFPVATLGSRPMRTRSTRLVLASGASSRETG